MIHTITLNPAIDHILYLDTFLRNSTNRVSRTAVTMGGKGTHVSMNLAAMGDVSKAYGFGFGKNGKKIIDMLTQADVLPCFVYDEQYGENRDNYLIVETSTKDASLIAQKGPVPSEEHVGQLYERIEEGVSPGESVVLSGDASNFTDPEAYNRIMEMLAYKNPRFFVDASGSTLVHAVAREPFLIKPNLEEMSLLAGQTLTTFSDVVDALLKLDRRCHIYGVVISLGAEGALARLGDRLYRVRPPKVDVYNTVGCGDCLLAGLIHGIEQKLSPVENLSFATACAAATAESPLSVGFDIHRAHQLLSRVSVTPV